MWRTFGSGALAGLLMVAAAGMAAAQDEELRMGDDPAYYQRVEVPEASLAIAVPGSWTLDLDVEYRPAEDGDPANDSWAVFFASDPVDGWCGINKHPHPGFELRDLAEASADSAAEGPHRIEIQLGEAYRIDARHPDGDGYVSYFYFESDDFMYEMICFAHERDPRDWMDIAETLEWLPADGDVPPPTKPIAPEPGASIVAAAELVRVEIPGTNLAASFPADWEVEPTAEEDQFELPAGYEAASVTRRKVLWAIPQGPGICSINTYEDMPLDPSRHGQLIGERLDSYESSVVRFGTATLPTGTAAWVAMDDPDEGLFAESYLFDVGQTRYEFRCVSDVGRDHDRWLELAETIESTLEPLTDEHELVRVELPAAGVELALPDDWTFEPSIEELSTFLPPPYDDVGEVAILRALEASGPDGAWCNVYAYEQMPMSLDEHAEWFASMVSTNTDYPATVETTAASLPLGESLRLVEDYDVGEVHVLYLFDLDGARRYLACGASVLPDDAWLSVAETVVPMSSPFPAWPDDAVGASEVVDLVTQLPVSGLEEGETFMHAACDRAVLYELTDGSYREALWCRLTGEPVEDQGQLPSETLSLTGGACERVSDVWAAHDGSEVWASSWSVTVEPDGTATATSWYEPEELDCEG